MNNEEIDRFISRIKNTVNTIAELLAEIDEEREKDRKEFNRRITTLEYAYARILEDKK